MFSGSHILETSNLVSHGEGLARGSKAEFVPGDDFLARSQSLDRTIHSHTRPYLDKLVVY